MKGYFPVLFELSFLAKECPQFALFADNAIRVPTLFRLRVSRRSSNCVPAAAVTPDNYLLLLLARPLNK